LSLDEHKIIDFIEALELHGFSGLNADIAFKTKIEERQFIDVSHLLSPDIEQYLGYAERSEMLLQPKLSSDRLIPPHQTTEFPIQQNIGQAINSANIGETFDVILGSQSMGFGIL